MPKRTHEHTNLHDGQLMRELAERGAELYHPINPHIREYQQRLGELSLTDGVPIIQEVPPEEPPDIAA